MTKLEKIQNYIQDRIEILEQRKANHIDKAQKYNEVGNHVDEEWELHYADNKQSAINELKWLQQHIKEMK